jgi:hypothetical protein
MESLSMLEIWEMASYVVTVVGFPFAIIVLMLEQKRERQNEEEEIYQRLSDEYANFLKLLLKNSDLRLLSPEAETAAVTPEQFERKKIIFDILVSLFERAFILVYEDEMNLQTRRLWASWDDYMRFWCRRRDFRASLDDLLAGEDPEFVNYMQKVAASETRSILK